MTIWLFSIIPEAAVVSATDAFLDARLVLYANL